MAEYVFHPNVQVIRDLADEMEEKLTSIVIHTIWHIKEHHARFTLTSINIGLQTMKFDRKDRLAFVSAIFGRELTSTKDLTIGEAQALRMSMLGENYSIRPQFNDILNEWRTNHA